MENNLEIETYSSGRVFLDELSHKTFDVIVSDFDMPDMTGLGILSELRPMSPIPFILFTGKGREEVAIQALNLGATFYLQKSMNSELMYTELLHFINLAYKKNNTELSLVESEQRYRTLVELSVESIVILAKRKIIFANPSFMKLVGAESQEEILGRTMTDFLGKESISAINDNYSKVSEGQEGPASIVKLKKLDNTLVSVIGQGKPISYHNEKAIIIFIQDLTEKLKLYEKEFLLEQLPIGVSITDNQGKIIDLNDIYVRFFNLPKQKLLQYHVSELYWDSQDRIKFVHAMEEQGEIKNFKLNIKCKSKTNYDWVKKTIIVSSKKITLQEKDFYLSIVAPLDGFE